MTDLTALIERVESGAGADRELDSDILDALNDPAAARTWPFVEGSYAASITTPVTSSLDAVLALIEARLPGTSWEVRRSGFGTPSQAMIWDPMKSPLVSTVARISVETTPARALLAAVLRAIQETRSHDR